MLYRRGSSQTRVAVPATDKSPREIYLAELGRIRAAWKGGRHLYLMAQPKSASTFFANVLAEALGWEMAQSSDVWSGPNDISIQAAIDLSDRDRVIRAHAHARMPAITLLNAVGARPVVLDRDPADSLISMLDHRVKGGRTLQDQALRRLSRDDQIRTVAADWLHWYANFRMTWRHAPHFGDRVLFLDYADVVSDPVTAADRALTHAGFPCETARIEQAVDRVGGDVERSNRNVGVTGRGDEIPADVRHLIGLLGLKTDR